MPDIRTQKCVFVSHCILAQSVMAEGLVKRFPGPIKPVLQWCIDNDVSIMQMPCPETLCAAGGLGRSPHGKKWYEENGLRTTSRSIATSQADYMAQLVDGGMDILAVIGIDFSPACAVNYLNKGRSIQKDQGIYVEELQRALALKKLSIVFVGISQRWERKLKRELNDLLERDSAHTHTVVAGPTQSTPALTGTTVAT